MKGLDQFAKRIEELGKFTSELNGELGTISFNPFDAESIEQAIVEMERMIDERSLRYPDNPMINETATDLKSAYRQSIIDNAAESRLLNNEEE